MDSTRRRAAWPARRCADGCGSRREPSAPRTAVTSRVHRTWVSPVWWARPSSVWSALTRPRRRRARLVTSAAPPFTSRRRRSCASVAGASTVNHALGASRCAARRKGEPTARDGRPAEEKRTGEHARQLAGREQSAGETSEHQPRGERQRRSGGRQAGAAVGKPQRQAASGSGKRQAASGSGKRQRRAASGERRAASGERRAAPAIYALHTPSACVVGCSPRPHRRCRLLSAIAPTLAHAGGCSRRSHHAGA